MKVEVRNVRSLQWKNGSFGQVIGIPGSVRHHLLPSAVDSRRHRRELYLRLARYRQVALTTAPVRMQYSAVL